MAATPELLADGLHFPEGPRWRQDRDIGNRGDSGRLWFSDVLAGRVMTCDLDGNLETVVEVPEMPSGLGWLPDGTLLVVSCADGRLKALRNGELVEYADLAGLNGLNWNDMVVDSQGRAYVGSWAPGLDEAKIPGPGNMSPFSHLALVEPAGDGSGKGRLVADRMTFPNGPAVSPDGKTLIVAESFGFRLTAFDVEENGDLSNRRIFADLGVPTDGICLDEEGCVWVAAIYYEYGGSGGYLRVRDGGEVVDRIDVQGFGPYACTLGGEEMRTLFMCESAVLGQDRHPGDGRLMVARVDVPGTGSP